MEHDKEILQHLNAISDNDWLDVVDKLTTYVHFKLKGRTLFGAHTEQNLGVNPVDYYVDEAIGKLFSLEWKWQFDKYSLLEQLQRVVGSMISTNVEKFKAKKENITLMEEDKLISMEKYEINDYEDGYYEVFKSALEECSKDDEDLQLYVMALDECVSFDEMVTATGFEKKKLYVLQKKMTRRVTTYLETNKELIK
jgi:dihydroxyacetone kinase-like predicted kinase